MLLDLYDRAHAFNIRKPISQYQCSIRRNSCFFNYYYLLFAMCVCDLLTIVFHIYKVTFVIIYKINRVSVLHMHTISICMFSLCEYGGEILSVF